MSAIESSARRSAVRLVAAAVLGLAVAVPADARAQHCSLIPAAENELWVGVGAEGGAPRSRVGVQASFNVADFVHVRGELSGGGYDTGAGAASGDAIELGVMLDAGALRICPALLAGFTWYEFEDRFEADRGEFRELRLGFRVPVGGSLGTAGSVRLGWLAAVDVLRRRWKHTSQSLVVTDRIDVVVGGEEDRSFAVEAQAGLQAWRGPVGLSVGLASRELGGRELTYFVHFSVRAAG